MTAVSDIRILSTPQALFEAAADDFVQAAKTAVAASGRFTVALSGGSTPKGLFQVLSTKDHDLLPWDRMFFFFGDERHVPPDSPESNYRMAKENLFSKVPVPEVNIYRIKAEDEDANRAAAEYEKTLREFFGLPEGQVPRFDLILLGMGPDGHTASLFPETSALHETAKLVVSNWVPKFTSYRITFTTTLLNAAGQVNFLVAGADKAAALKAVLESNESADLYPSKRIHPVNGKLEWLVDEAAAQQLRARSA
jgi:6-phosphogluconolactonase